MARAPLAPGQSSRLSIASCHDGAACDPGERVEVEIRVHADELAIAIDAPYFADPPPSSPVGSTDRLWDYEVVEVMLLGADQRYLEVELSPHGHYLVLELHGERHVVRQGMTLSYRAAIHGPRWQGEARVPLAWLPPACDRLNAYAIHGQGDARRYLAWRAPGGERPDFHRLESFGAWPREPSCDTPGR